MLCPLVCACVRCLCVCVHVHEVEKAVALWRGRALLSLVGGGGGGVGGGRQGYVNAAAVRAAEGFEWREEGRVGGGDSRQPGPSLNHQLATQRRGEDKNSTKRRAL